MRRRGWTCVAIAVGLLAAVFVSWQDEETPAATPETCLKPSVPLRYPAVKPIFSEHCGACHDATRGDNAAAQRVFEQSSYPFATSRPEGLLTDLRHMFESRGGIPAEQRCTALRWLEGGALDARGQPPQWRE